MSHPSDPITDPQRVAALRRAGLLDSPPEESFDRLTSAASAIMDASVALVSLVAEDRQFLKSARDPAGAFRAESEQELAFSICRYAVATRQPVLINDARQNPDFRDHPAVLNGQVVAYAGFPIIVEGGAAIGTVCVVDNRPREWGEQQIAALSDLAHEAADLVAKRAASTDAEARLFAAKAGLASVTEAAAQEASPTPDGAALVARTESPGQRAGGLRIVPEAEANLAAAVLFFLKQLDAYALSLDAKVAVGDVEGQSRLRTAVVTAQAGLLRAVEAFDSASVLPSKRHEAAQALRDSCAAYLDAEAGCKRTGLLFRRGKTGIEEIERCASETSAAEHSMRFALRDYSLSVD